MRYRKSIWLNALLIINLAICASCNVTIAPTSEIPDIYLKEIAMIRADPHWGAAVIYNPDTCKEIGEACGFFRLHAFAHNHLNHTLLAKPSSYPVSLETQADCWAAKYGKSNEVYAATQLLLDKNRNPAWIIHGDAQQRAKNIRICAIENENWLEIN